LLPAFDDLTGKTISSNFDPWEAPSFKECLPDIAQTPQGSDPIRSLSLLLRL
jgi:hypothetical protein